MSGWSMAHLAEEAANRVGKAPPDRMMVGEGTATTGGQRIDAPSPSRLPRRPAAAQQASLLQAVQGGVNRALGQIEGATATATNLLDHRVAVRRAARQRGEHDHVEVAFQHLAFHKREDIPSDARCQRSNYRPWNTGRRCS